MAISSGVSPASAADSRRVRAALGAAALVLAALGVLYWAYVQRRTQYLVDRDLRLLSVAAAQIEAVLDSRKQIVRNFAETQFWCTGAKLHEPITTYPSKEADAQKLTPYLANFTDLRRGAAIWLADSVPVSASQDGYCITRENAIVRIEYYAARPEQPVARPDSTYCPVLGSPHAVGRLTLDSLVTPVLDNESFGVFDSIVIATPDGSVVKQVQPHGAQARRSVLSRGRSVAGHNAPTVLVLSTLRGIVDRNSKDGKPVSLDALQSETRSSDVEISGVRYLLLSQPYAFAAPAGDGRGTQRWIIAGLVTHPQFMRDATEISTSLIELVIAGLVLLVCCWPFMKLAFSGPGEPVTRADVVMGGIATLLGGGMIALLLADVFAYSRIESTADYHQRAFAAVMHEDLQRGLVQVVRIGGILQALTKPDAIRYEQDRTAPMTHSEGEYWKQLPPEMKIPYSYGFFSQAAWVNDRGEQVVQVAMRNGPPPLPSVAKRQYFHALREGHHWTWFDPFPEDQPKEPHQFFIESVRTLATGASEAVIAFPVSDERNLPDLHVFTLSFPFVEIGAHVSPPDLAYAVVDPNGDVVFGSEPDRNGVENVFTETDQNRTLRAAVNARQEDFVDTKYRGEDKRILATPLEGLPWTLLTFRDKGLLRTMNLDTLAMTFILFLLYLGAIVLVVVTVLLVRPTYHVPWVWPVERRLPHWRRVWLLLAVTGIAFILAIYALASASRLAVACLAPFYAYLGSYLVLSPEPKRGDGSRKPRRLAYGLSLTAWAAITVIFAWGCVAAPLAEELAGSAALSVVPRVFMLFCLLAAFCCVVVPAKESNRERWREFSRTYVACGVLSVVLVAVLPMMACFRAALEIESEALIKSGQRRMTDLFLQRIETLARHSWSDSTNTLPGYPIPFFFESHWCIQMDSIDTSSPCGYRSSARFFRLRSTACAFEPAVNRVGEVLDEYLPVYSEDSVEMRALHSGQADDGSWRAVRAGRIVALTRRFELSDDAQTKLLAQFNAPFDRRPAPALLQLTEPIRKGQAWLTIVSRMPTLLPDRLRAPDPIRPFPRVPRPATSPDQLPPASDPQTAANTVERIHDQRIELLPGEITSFPKESNDPSLPGPLRGGAYLLAAVVAFCVLLWAVRFAARRILLYDLREPRWLDPPMKPPLGEHIFLVHPPASLNKLIDLQDMERVSFDDLRDTWRPVRWAERLALVDGSAKRVVLCEGFGDGLNDMAFTKRKFTFIESMMQLTDCTVIISSAVSPALFLNLYDDLDDATRARWEAVLSMFVWIDESRLLTRDKASDAADDGRIPPSREEIQNASNKHATDLTKLPGRLRDRVKSFSLLRHWLRIWACLWSWCAQFTPKGREERDREDDLDWIDGEAQPSPFLKSFAVELRSLPGGREQILDELRERADRYYHALWTMCSSSERMVLYHVAHYGVANYNNRRVIRRLIARGLLRRDGELRLFNSTFRLFVLTRADEIRQQRENAPEGRSTFDRIRVPLFVGILVVLGILVGTQKDLANATSAILTALATGLPLIVKLIGTVTDRRVGTPN